MKLTPMGKAIIVVALLVAAFFAVRRFAPEPQDLGHRRQERHGRRARQPTTVSKGDFDALGNAPADPERGKGSKGVTPASNSAAAASSTARWSSAINTWAGHSPGIVFNGGLEPSAALAATSKKYGLDVKFVLLEDPAAKLAAFRKGDVDIMWDTVDNWAREASILAEQNQKAQVDHHAGLVARRRRHRLARVDQLDRGPQGAQDRLHAVHAVALPAALPARAVGPVAGGPRGGREEHRLHRRTRRPPRPMFKAKQVDAAVTWEPDLSGAVDGARRRGPRAGLDHRGHQHHRRHAWCARQDLIDQAPETRARLRPRLARRDRADQERSRRAPTPSSARRSSSTPTPSPACSRASSSRRTPTTRSSTA